MKYADHQFWLDGIPKGQKISRRESLGHVAKSLGRMPKEIQNAPKCPEGTDYIWRIFVDLKNAGSASYSEMAAYQQMTGERLTPFEVDCIRRLDEAHARAQR